MSQYQESGVQIARTEERQCQCRAVNSTQRYIERYNRKDRTITYVNEGVSPGINCGTFTVGFLKFQWCGKHSRKNLLNY